MATYDPSIGGCHQCQSFHGCCCPTDTELDALDAKEELAAPQLDRGFRNKETGDYYEEF